MLQTLPAPSPSSLVLVAWKTRLSCRANSTTSSTAVAIDEAVAVAMQRDNIAQSASAYRGGSGKSDWQSCLLGQLNSVASADLSAFAVRWRTTNRIDFRALVVAEDRLRQRRGVED